MRLFRIFESHIVMDERDIILQLLEPDVVHVELFVVNLQRFGLEGDQCRLDREAGKEIYLGILDPPYEVNNIGDRVRQVTAIIETCRLVRCLLEVQCLDFCL